MNAERVSTCTPLALTLLTAAIQMKSFIIEMMKNEYKQIRFHTSGIDKLLNLLNVLHCYLHSCYIVSTFNIAYE